MTTLASPALKIAVVAIVTRAEIRKHKHEHCENSCVKSNLPFAE